MIIAAYDNQYLLLTQFIVFEVKLSSILIFSNQLWLDKSHKLTTISF
jgi:hypothetical protein